MKLFLFFFMGIQISLNAQNVLSLSGKGNGQLDCVGIQNIENQSWLLNFSNAGSGDQNLLVDDISKVSGWVASLAIDKKNNVFFMPIVSSDVYTYNTFTKQVKKLPYSSAIQIDTNDEGSFYARMCSAPNGKIYLINNKGSQLVEIDPNTHAIRNLGSLTSRGAKSIANKNDGWGGDMFADIAGNLYVLSVRGNVFKIYTNQLISEYIGQIKGLPANFTTNGAAVLNQKDILVANASGNNLYTFNLSTLQAKVYQQSGVPVYDLASSNFVNNTLGVEDILPFGDTQLYPTMIKDREFHISSHVNVEDAKVNVYSLNGQILESFTTDLQDNSASTFSIKNLPPNVYLVKAVDSDGKEILTEKITVLQ